MTDDKSPDAPTADNDDDASFADLLDGYLDRAPTVEPGVELTARVVSIGPEHVYLDIGARSEGLLSRGEVTQDGELTVAEGDTMKVFVTAIQDGAVLCAQRLVAAGSGERPSDRAAALAALGNAQASGLPVEGVVKEVVKGGLTVSVMGQRAFCPISQIDRGFCEDPSIHLEHSYSFLIRRVDDRGRNVVVSRRELLEREAEHQAQALWETLEVGAVFEGEVRSVQKFGAFVDIGGAEGLVHVSEIAYERVEDPGQILQVGQPVRVAVKSLDRERSRIGLSLKALMDDPWLEAKAALTPNSVHTGRVVRIAPFGAFVEVMRGVDGLVHISELGGGRRIQNPREVVSEGAEISVRVLEFDAERRRVSLGLAGDTGVWSGDADEPGSPSIADGRASAQRPTAAGGESFGTFGDLFGGVLKK